MLSTIADNGMYHQAHVIKYWQQGADGAEQMPRVDHADRAAVRAKPRTFSTRWSKRPSTVRRPRRSPSASRHPARSSARPERPPAPTSGFFIGSTTQYSLVVGMFTLAARNNPNNLASSAAAVSVVTGRRRSGTPSPRRSSRRRRSSSRPTRPSRHGMEPARPGPKAAKKSHCTETFNGQTVSIVEKGCPTPKSKNCTFDSKDNWVCGNGIGNGNNGNGTTGTGTGTGTTRRRRPPASTREIPPAALAGSKARRRRPPASTREIPPATAVTLRTAPPRRRAPLLAA